MVKIFNLTYFKLVSVLNFHTGVILDVIIEISD